MTWALPCRPLRRYVDRYWLWRPPAAREILYAPLLPGTGAELLIQSAAPLKRSDGSPLPDGALVCVRRRALSLAPAAQVSFVAVRFRAAALRHFTAIPLARLADVACSAEDLWGAPAHELAGRVGSARSFEAQAAALDRFLLMTLDRFARADSRPDRVARAIYQARGALRIEELATTLDLSRRQLERSFKAALGVTPKAFARVARLQTTVRAVLTTGAPRYLGPSLEAGYFDQAHFIHEFQRIAGTAPGPYFAVARGGAHFYQTSRST